MYNLSLDDIVLFFYYIIGVSVPQIPALIGSLVFVAATLLVINL